MYFDGFTYRLCIALCIGKSNQRIIVSYTPNKFASYAIGKGTHTLAPALWSLDFQNQFFIVFCSFAYQLADIIMNFHSYLSHDSFIT